MPDISSIGHGPAGPIGRAAHSASTSDQVRTGAIPGRGETSSRIDRVEVSDHARLLARLKSLPEIRQDLVSRVRDEIQAGTYETPQKLDAALNQLIDELA